MKSNHLYPLAGLALLALAAPVIAHSFSVGKIAIGHPWTRETAATQTVGGGFLTVRNNGKTADRLVSTTSPFATEVQMHSMSMDRGVMKMRQLKEGIAIAAGKTVELKPGGLHIMFIGLKKAFKKGAKIPATLKFERAGSVKVEFAVQPVGSTAPMEAGHVGH
ncbi:MAG: copper chaperone PCu(A)C [Sphingomonadales bacterium]|jgi:copper(I)-binding protein|nr:copper chaperone PCu(A)C [Sphingomonadales bacterium]MBK9002378.1 copper chaperone PCu(A)C [Sphingomonadales bacterium]MBK9267608.1 copper chaperone PCu(A)C [Sphingomonadales bacterium]MBP6433162.1 copper chaperone PCu(A)C [Sphingorhabdus sp.]